MKRQTCTPYVYLSLTLLFAATLAPRTAAGQENEGIELFWGYSFIKTDPGIEGLDAFGANGFHIEATRPLTRKLGIGAEVSGHFGSTSTDLEGLSQLSSSQVSVLVGPRMSGLQLWRFRLSSRAMIGLSSVTLQDDDGLQAIESLHSHQTDLAISLGASLDLQLNERLSIRLIQSNRFYTFFGDDSQKQNRYSSGIMLRL